MLEKARKLCTPPAPVTQTYPTLRFTVVDNTMMRCTVVVLALPPEVRAALVTVTGQREQVSPSKMHSSIFKIVQYNIV